MLIQKAGVMRTFPKYNILDLPSYIVEVRWPPCQRTCLRIRWYAFKPWPETCCVVFLGKTLNSHSAFFHPGV